MKTVDEVDRLDTVVEINAKDLEDKKTTFARKKEEVAKANDELAKITAVMQSMESDAGKNELKEDTIFEFVQASNPLHAKWIRKQAKKNAVEECIMQLKKSYEDKVITLQELLKYTRQLSGKQFMCIYIMAVVERHIKKIQGK